MPADRPGRTAAELIVACLENEGVTHVFGIPGEENIRLVDAISRSGIEYVLARHEQGASFMAETYGRLTGKAGVCSATLGPGAINLLLGTADATTNSTPLVALSAQVGTHRSFKESHQGVALVPMFAPVTKWSALVPSAGAVPEMIRKAFKLAQTERPGAVYLAVPEDVEQAAAGGGLAPLNLNVPRPDEPSPGQVARAAEILRAARSPIVLAGHGAARAGAGAALHRFATALGVPVATTFHGKGVFPDDQTAHLRHGLAKSCGCQRGNLVRAASTSHGLTRRGQRHPLYQTWYDMVHRCHDLSSKNYPNYGARGIEVSPEWRDDPRPFIEYAETLEHYGEPGYSLDRIDNDGPYAAGNIKFSTITEQNRNQRRNILAADDVREIRGLRRAGHSLKDLAEQFETTESYISKIVRRENWPDVYQRRTVLIRDV